MNKKISSVKLFLSTLFALLAISYGVFGEYRRDGLCGERPSCYGEKEYGESSLVAGVAMASLYAVSRHDLLPPTEESYQIGTRKSTRNHSVGITYRSDNTVILDYHFSF